MSGKHVAKLAKGLKIDLFGIENILDQTLLIITTTKDTNITNRTELGNKTSL